MKWTNWRRLCEDSEIETWGKREDTDIRGEAGSWKRTCGGDKMNGSVIVCFDLYVCNFGLDVDFHLLSRKLVVLIYFVVCVFASRFPTDFISQTISWYIALYMVYAIWCVLLVCSATVSGRPKSHPDMMLQICYNNGVATCPTIACPVREAVRMAQTTG